MAGKFIFLFLHLRHLRTEGHPKRSLQSESWVPWLLLQLILLMKASRGGAARAPAPVYPITITGGFREKKADKEQEGFLQGADDAHRTDTDGGRAHNLPGRVPDGTIAILGASL